MDQRGESGGLGMQWVCWYVAPLVMAGGELLPACRGWRALEFSFVSAAVLATSQAIFGR
jgi:hypothetical protein